ncbi:hypothetical protein NEOKW01_1281 [Nematocida sp. AWRm80]|nr:hypothetical protein NEOKW01_1281 [Nematocida sp. AWRm80]
MSRLLLELRGLYTEKYTYYELNTALSNIYSMIHSREKETNTITIDYKIDSNILYVYLSQYIPYMIEYLESDIFTVYNEEDIKEYIEIIKSNRVCNRCMLWCNTNLGIPIVMIKDNNTIRMYHIECTQRIHLSTSEDIKEKNKLKIKAEVNPQGRSKKE